MTQETANMENTTKHEFKAEMKQLLHLIIHSLYTHPEVFLRELVSNSSDALNKIRFKQLTDKDILDGDQKLKIKIDLDKENQMFSISDNGIGMDYDDLTGKLGTIASSGTIEFLQNLQKDGKKIDGDMIGQFGVGFYSLFMVTDSVRVETRSFEKDSTGYVWTSNGEESFDIEEVEGLGRGTKISFKLKDDYKEFSEDFKIKATLKKYSNFVDFPVFVGEEEANSVGALWHKKKAEITSEEYDEFYKFISGDFNPPMGSIHLDIEGNVNFKAVLFIPGTAPQQLLSQDQTKTLDLYVNRVFIQDDNKEILPDYLKFIRGVVDTEDLPLNVSREVTQSSPAMRRIKNILVGKILTWLKDMSKDKPEDYEIFYKNFGPLFKLGSTSDYENKDKIMPLLRFESTRSKSGEFLNLDDYIERLKDEQEEIFYVSGPTRSQAETNPNLEYFNKNELEVLLLSDPSDVFTVPYLMEYKGKKFTAIDKAEIKDDEKNENDDDKNKEQSESLIKMFKEVLGEKTEDVIESSRLVDSPVTLVSGKNAMDSHMEKMMAMMDKNFTGAKKVLEVNVSHPLIKNLSDNYTKNGNNIELRQAVESLYDSALLIEGNLENPNTLVKKMYEYMQKATS
jgi:molecular chaperone HtpG